VSLIDDALRAAQREKSRLDAQAGRPFTPVLVRLRSQPRAGVNRTYLLAAGAALITLVAVGAWIRSMRDAQLPDVPPVTSAILSEALADTVRRDSRQFAQQAGQPSAALALADAPRPGEATAPVGVASAPTSQLADRATIPAGERSRIVAPWPGAATARPEDPPATAPAARQAGALRIALEQPREADAARLFTQAVAAHRASDFARALALYEQVLAVVPDDADALNNLGVLLSANREFDRALTLLRRATTLAPHNAGAWNNVGAVYREQGKGAEAVAAFQHALSIDPKHQGARVGLAQQYLATGALAQAAELLRGVLHDNPSLPEAHYTLGQVLELQGDRLGAIAAYAAFVRLAPTRLAAHAELVQRRIDALSAGQ
jgi:tetratricopeptide (TPR) repeat protein